MPSRHQGIRRGWRFVRTTTINDPRVAAKTARANVPPGPLGPVSGRMPVGDELLSSVVDGSVTGDSVVGGTSTVEGELVLVSMVLDVADP